MRTTAIVALALVAVVPAARAGGLNVGRASVDITPEPGTPVNGPLRPGVPTRLTTAAHDPLRAKAVVLEQGGVRAALVECDLTSIPLAIITEARRLVGSSTRIDPDSVMIGATHCHTAPQLRPRLFGDADEEARRKGLAYIGALPSRIAEAVRLAEADLRPARASVALGSEGSISFNRRFYLRDGSVQTNPFKGDDAKLGRILRPTGPIDPEVGVVSFDSEAGEPLATLVNFALHLDTVGGEAPSADFPHTLEKILGEVDGPGALAFFANGAAGNINHYDLLDPAHPRRTKGHAEAARIGAILAAEVLRSRPRRVPVPGSGLRTVRELVRLDYNPERARGLLERMGDDPRHFDGEVEVTRQGDRLGFDAEVQAIALGDELAWVGLPGEMFVELGLALKAASPFRYTMIHELSNGAIGYVPNLRAYPEGAYEASSTRCAPGSGERLVEAATRLLIRLKNEGRG